MNAQQPDYVGHRRRLKQRFLLGGGRDMADYELLELVLTLAIPRRDVKPLAKKLVAEFGNFAKVIAAPEYRLRKINGVSDGVVTVLKIITVAAQRLSWQNLASDDKPVLINVDHLIDFCRSTIAYSEVEELHVIYLNAKLNAIGCALLQKGSLSSVSASPRDIVMDALQHNAAGIILVHNHPSGAARPSENDLKLTNNVAQACQLMGIRLHEHIIITQSEYFSFLEHGLIKN